MMGLLAPLENEAEYALFCWGEGVWCRLPTAGAEACLEGGRFCKMKLYILTTDGTKISKAKCNKYRKANKEKASKL